MKTELELDKAMELENRLSQAFDEIFNICKESKYYNLQHLMGLKKKLLIKINIVQNYVVSELDD